MNGKRILKYIFRYLLSFSCLIIVCFSLSACRSDWTYGLPEGYNISRVNTCQCLLTKNTPDGIRNEVVLPNYFIVKFTVCGDYILLSGIETADGFASDEELKATNYIYYVVGYKNDKILGPFTSEELMLGQLEKLGVVGDLLWIETNHIKEDGFWG